MIGNGHGDDGPQTDDSTYRSLIEAMDTAVLLMRGPACVTCNPASARLFGLERPEQLLGKTPLDFAPPVQPDGTSSAEVMANNFAQAHAKGVHAFEWLTTRADGQPITLEVRFAMLPSADGLYLCTAVDISDRKRAEQALRESEARFRTIFERAVEGILVVEVETRQFKFANPALCQLLGYDREELLTLRTSDIHPADELPAVLDALERHLHGGVGEVQTCCVRKDKSRVSVVIHSATFELDGQQYLARFISDTTARRQLDEERLKTQKLDAIGRLAGGIAHDFNNLLQGVFGYISLARLTLDDRQGSLAMLEQAEKALHQSVQLTNQLLTFSKGGQPVKRPLAVSPVLRSATGLALSGTRADSELTIADELWCLEADEGQLAQVFHNIVLNAAQAMPLGGTVRVAAENVRSPDPALPMQLPAGDFVAVSVSDTGVGIPPQYLMKIFDPYFTTKEKGTGLGLATSYAIVTNHHGLIDVKSVVGEGSTFTIYLPAQVDLAPELRQNRERDTGASRPARVLVMDDDPLVRNVTARLLAGLGHSVDVAEHGELAIELYRRAAAIGKPYALVILDLTVRGGLGGVETARRLRELDPDVRVVVSSGYSDEAANLAFGEQGFQAFLKKPFDLETLSATVEPILRRR